MKRNITNQENAWLLEQLDQESQEQAPSLLHVLYAVKRMEYMLVKHLWHLSLNSGIKKLVNFNCVLIVYLKGMV